MSTADPLLITNTSVDGALKVVHADFRMNSFPIATVLLAQIKKGTPNGPERMQWGGRKVVWDVRLGRPTGGNASDLGYLGVHSAVDEKQAELGIKRFYVTRHIDRLAAVGTQSREAAYVGFASKITEEALDAARLFQQESLHGNGLGVKAAIGTVNSTTSIIVSSPYGVSGAGEGGLLLDKDMYIAVLDSTGATLRGRSAISACTNSGDNATLTLATAISGMTAGDIVVSASPSDTSYNQLTNGLINITNRGNSYQSFEGLSSSDYPRWDSLRMVAGTDTPDANQITEVDIWDLIRRVANRSGKDPQVVPDEFLLVSTPGMCRQLGQTFLGQRRWDMGMKKLKGDFGAYEICGLPLIQDFYCPAGTVYLIHKPSLTWVDLQDWQKVAFEDASTWRPIQGRDAYEINWGIYWNAGALHRITHGSITGYTDTFRATHTM